MATLFANNCNNGNNGDVWTPTRCDCLSCSQLSIIIIAIIIKMVAAFVEQIAHAHLTNERKAEVTSEPISFLLIHNGQCSSRQHAPLDTTTFWMSTILVRKHPEILKTWQRSLINIYTDTSTTCVSISQCILIYHKHINASTWIFINQCNSQCVGIHLHASSYIRIRSCAIRTHLRQ